MKKTYKEGQKGDLLSESQSKGFRTKTASVMKSIKYNDDIRGSMSGAFEKDPKERIKADRIG